MGKNKNIVHIGNILDDMFETEMSGTGNIISDIARLWKEIVENQVAECSRPFALKSSILLVHVSNSVYLHHLVLMKKKLIHNLNNTLSDNQISDIKFKIGKI